MHDLPPAGVGTAMTPRSPRQREREALESIDVDLALAAEHAKARNATSALHFIQSAKSNLPAYKRAILRAERAKPKERKQ